MILTLKKKGKILQKVKFWSDRTTLEVGQVTVLVGANGSGKTATLDAIAAYCGVFSGKSDRENYRSADEVRESVGEIEPDVSFANVLRYQGTTAHGMPSAVLTNDDIFRIDMQKRSHGEAGIFTLARQIMTPLRTAVGETLLLLDEIETGLSAEAQTLVARSIASEAVGCPWLKILVATQSDRVRAAFLLVGEELDFGGWIGGNPWRNEEVEKRRQKENGR
jgi:predicted ATPase